jgi:hypothetical protein
MDGGTASVYAPRAWEAFGEFSASTATAKTASAGTVGDGEHGPTTR